MLKITSLKVFAGMESDGFNAILNLNNKKIATVADFGHGGPIDFQFYGNKEALAWKEFVAQYPEEKMPDDIGEDCLKSLYINGYRKLSGDEIVNNAVEALKKDKLRKNNVLFRLPEDRHGTYNSVKVRKGNDRASVEKWVIGKYPQATFI